jgi:hypothetical protein
MVGNTLNSKNDSQIFCAAIAAPLNPAYKKDEFKFYLEDIKAKIVLVPSNNEAQPAREAAKELNIPLWEISFTHSGGDVHVNLNPLDHVESPAAVKPVSNGMKPRVFELTVAICRKILLKAMSLFICTLAALLADRN